MKTRREIRAAARQAMANRRGVAILLPIVLVLVIIGMVLIPSIGMIISEIMDIFVLYVVFLVIYIIVLLFADVLAVGFWGAYTKIYMDEEVGVGEIFSGYRKFGRNWLAILWTAFMMLVWLVVMGLVLLAMYIVGYHVGLAFLPFLVLPVLYIFLIAKIYSYYYVYEVLHQSENISPIQALRASVRITKGHRWSMFVMGLSFIGWYILGLLTFGILLVVFVNPYFYTSITGHYVEMRKKAIANSVITEEELA
ncbi:MAG: DUF975 family protein [Defluviitaleaceae bacterium]|nr:DUF975 family protein [Defluviitaleaceae bacterium]